MKLIQFDQAIKLVENNMLVGFGGNVLHRSPNKIAYGLAKSELKSISVVKTAIAFEADILSAYRKLEKLIAGFVSYESEFGLANIFRKNVELGITEFEEHACYSVIMGLRAASYGIPFIPIKGFNYSDIPAATDKRTTIDPYSKNEVLTVKAIIPDIVFIHVQKSNLFGDCWIDGPLYEDDILAKSGKVVVVTCEQLVGDEDMGRVADVSGVLVDYVVLAPHGAFPGSCYPYYDVDKLAMKKLKNDILEFSFIDIGGSTT